MATNIHELITSLIMGRDNHTITDDSPVFDLHKSANLVAQMRGILDDSDPYATEQPSIVRENVRQKIRGLRQSARQVSPEHSLMPPSPASSRIPKTMTPGSDSAVRSELVDLAQASNMEGDEI